MVIWKEYINSYISYILSNVPPGLVFLEVLLLLPNIVLLLISTCIFFSFQAFYYSLLMTLLGFMVLNMLARYYQ